MQPEAETTFGRGVEIEKERKVGGEFACGCLLYLALFIQVCMCFAVFGAKNAEMAGWDEDGSLRTCPGDYVSAESCGRYQGDNRLLNIGGLCISPALCEETATCVAGGRRLSEQDLDIAQFARALPSGDYDRRLAAETGPAPKRRLLERQLAQRRLDTGSDIPDNVWKFLEQYAYQPITLFAAAAIFAGAWLFCIQRAARAAIWGTIVADVLMLIVVFIWYKAEIDVWNWACIVCVALIVAAAIFLRKQIDHTAVILTEAMNGLASNKRVFAVCLCVQLVWVGYFALWIAAIMAMHFTLEATPAEELEPMQSGQWCELTMQSWVGNPGTMTFWVLTYYWVTFFFRNINLMVVTANLSGWWFNQEGYKSFWVKALKWSLLPQAGANAMASAIMGLSEYLLSRVGSVWDIVFNVMLPWNWIFLCLAFCLKTILMTFTKFGLIAATFSGRPFCEASGKSFTMLKEKVGEAVLVDYLGARIMAWATYVIALGAAFAAWAWADNVQGLDTMGEIDLGLMIFLIFLYAYVMSYPFAALILVIMIENLISGVFDSCGDSCDVVRAVLNSIFASLFIGSICMFLLTHVSRVVVNSMDTIFFCFAVEAENKAEEQERFQKLYGSIKTMIAPGGVQGDSNVVSGTPVQQPPQAVPAQPAESPVVVGTAMPESNNNV